jgi:TfoX/Sxy family transcriptional regulator of competence genes
MAYDEGLAQRIREMTEEHRGITEKKMFGGLAFLQGGHMFTGIIGEKLMVRCGPQKYHDLLKKSHVGAMDFTGKPMTGYLFVAPEGYERDAELLEWINTGVEFVALLKPKTGKPVKRRLS